MGLLYGPGNITRSELASIQTPEPKGKWHNPVPFDAYVEMITDAIGESGYTIQQEEFQVVNDVRLFGAMLISPRDTDSFFPSFGSDLVVGLRGSHDKMVSRGICIGTRVTVCSNLCFSGDLDTFHTRQTLNVYERLAPMIQRTIDRVGERAETERRRISAYRDHNFGTSQAGDALLVEMLRKEVLTLPQFVKAANEWVEPSFIEHQADGNYSAWNMLNAVTEAMKPKVPEDGEVSRQFNHLELSNRTSRVVEFLDETLGLEAA